jgi:type III secretory pathway component EscR
LRQSFPSLSLAIYKALVEGKSVMRNYEVIALLAVNAFFALISIQRTSVLMVLVAVAVPYVLGRQRVTAPLVASIVAGLLLLVFVMSPVMLYLRSGNLEFYSFRGCADRLATFRI